MHHLFKKYYTILITVLLLAVSCNSTQQQNKEQTITSNFKFKDSIDEQVLKNYLSRSITLTFMSGSAENIEANIQLINELGVKYISRAITPWVAETEHDIWMPKYKNTIDKAHKLDTDIIFEACIFETVFPNANNVQIPAWVFSAFNLPIETRPFNADNMLFPNGNFHNHWGNGGSVPDITQLETQLYFYFRACKYIDAGFEAIHWGQVLLMGKDDPDFHNYYKLFEKVRQYAKDNSRRGFTLHNAHIHGVKDTQNNLLFDFHCFPIRMRTPEGAEMHAISDSTPQMTLLEENHLDAIYNKSVGGIAPSGWECNSLPYFVEIDNYGQDKNNLNIPGIEYWPWGMDEISWFANQPASYRLSWLQYAHNWIKETDNAGFLCMPGSRPYYSIKEDKNSWYNINSPLFEDDKEAIVLIWGK
ncbi:MAG: hypothetical protein GX664_03750 [Bacteroidales bacterium]|nr:hypothetical protein [Bacteroidales bacterium]